MTTPRSVLVVEDRGSLRRLIERALSAEGHEVQAAETVREALSMLEGCAFDIVLTDLKLPDATGLDVLDAVRQTNPHTPVVVMTAFGEVSVAVEAMKRGATNFLEKPVEIDDLLRMVPELTGDTPDVRPGLSVPGGPLIIGRHPRLRAAIRLVERVAPVDSTVLLLGESGTGKELFARAVHGLSARSEGPFVALNCAAIPESLIENELFGHEKGAFTGASSRQTGRFEEAEGGTLLLDEIGELNLAVQAKVLRVLEDRTFQRVGGGRTRTADVRLVAATNRDLEGMVEAGGFRSDLFYRLNVFPIELPALRERASDVPLLCDYLLERLAAKQRSARQRSAKEGAAPEHEERVRLSEGAIALLCEEKWPGNIRQLANVLERAVILTPGNVIERSDIEALIEPLAEKDDREVLREALRETDGDKKAAAQLLGVSYRTVLRRVKEHHLEGFPRYRKD